MTPKTEDKLIAFLENLPAEKYHRKKLPEDPMIRLLHPQCRKKPWNGHVKKKQKKDRSPRRQK